MSRLVPCVIVVALAACSPGTPRSDAGAGTDAGTGCTYTISGALPSGTGQCAMGAAWSRMKNETYFFGTHPTSATGKGEYGIFLPGEAAPGTYTTAAKGSLAVYEGGGTWIKTAPVTFTLTLTDVRLRLESGDSRQYDLDGTLSVEVPAGTGGLGGTATGTVSVVLTF